MNDPPVPVISAPSGHASGLKQAAVASTTPCIAAAIIAPNRRPEVALAAAETERKRLIEENRARAGTASDGRERPNVQSEHKPTLTPHQEATTLATPPKTAQNDWYTTAQTTVPPQPPKPGFYLVPEKTQPAKLEAYRPRYARNTGAVNGVPDVTFKTPTYKYTKCAEIRGLFADSIRHADIRAIVQAYRPVPNRHALLARSDWAVAFQIEIEALEFTMHCYDTTIREHAAHWALCNLFRAQLLVHHEFDVTPYVSQIRYVKMTSKDPTRTYLSHFTGCNLIDILWTYRGDGMLTRSKAAYFVFASAADAKRADNMIRDGLGGYVKKVNLQSEPLRTENGQVNWTRFSNARQRRLEVLNLIKSYTPAAPTFDAKLNADFGHATATVNLEQPSSNGNAGGILTTTAARWSDVALRVGTSGPNASGAAHGIQFYDPSTSISAQAMHNGATCGGPSTSAVTYSPYIGAACSVRSASAAVCYDTAYSVPPHSANVAAHGHYYATANHPCHDNTIGNSYSYGANVRLQPYNN